MGNAVLCDSREDVEEKHFHTPNVAQRQPKNTPRRPITPPFPACSEPKSPLNIRAGKDHVRVGHSRRHRRQRDHHAAAAGTNPLPLGTCSPCPSSDPDHERASVTPHLEWLPSLSHYIESHHGADPQQEHVADPEALLSYSGSEGAVTAQSRAVSTLPASPSYYLNLSNSELNPSPNFSFDEHLAYIGAPECRAPLSDPPTPVPPPLLRTLSPVKRPDSSDPLTPFPSPPLARTASSPVIAPATLAARSSNTDVSRDSVEGATQPTKNRRGAEGNIKSLSKKRPSTSSMSSSASSASPTPVSQPTHAHGECRPLHAVYDKKTKRTITSFLTTYGFQIRRRKRSVPQHVTGSAAVAPTSELVTAAGNTKAASPPRRENNNSPIPCTSPAESPAPTYEFMSMINNKENQKDTNMPSTEDDFEDPDSATLLWEALAAHEVYCMSAVDSSPLGTPAVSAQPDKNGFSMPGRGREAMPPLPLIKEPRAPRTRMKPAKDATGRKSQGPSEKFPEAQRYPLLHKEGKCEAVKPREGDSPSSAIGDQLFTFTKEDIAEQCTLRTDPPAGSKKMRAVQDLLSSLLVSSSPSPEESEDGEEQFLNLKGREEGSSENRQESFGDSILSLKHVSLSDAISNANTHLKIDSILKKFTGQRYHEGSPFERASPAVGSVSFLLDEEEAALALVSRQCIAKAISRRSKVHQEDL